MRVGDHLEDAPLVAVDQCPWHRVQGQDCCFRITTSLSRRFLGEPDSGDRRGGERHTWDRPQIHRTCAAQGVFSRDGTLMGRDVHVLGPEGHIAGCVHAWIVGPQVLVNDDLAARTRSDSTGVQIQRLGVRRAPDCDQ